jgi:hypothetical protein
MAVAGAGSTIGGVAVEEPLFLDEPAGYGKGAPKHTGPSPFDLFANEEEKPLWGTFPALGPGPKAAQPGLARLTPLAAVPRWRLVLSKCVLVVALAALAGIGAGQALGLTPVDLWRLSAQTVAGR